MARRSQTEVAVLGALSVAPMTGYAVREAIRDVLGHFWSESFGQIYPTLAGLEERGYVRRADRAAPFELTGEGVARLRELLAEPPQRVPPRNGVMLRLFFGRQLGPEACRALLLEAKADAERQLAEFAALRAAVAGEGGPDTPYSLITISAGVHTARAALAWAEESLAALPEATPSELEQPGAD
ncbi:PadR family transcriptional regulator [Actinokineospora diospyrosa]|uniref:Transcriptional regulator, PadR family n=1 Tax=Actinokineospora diospyrosa TaxID=103728 RepID=A0ABT1INV3_9PSEU|nr:PadR family transcriptional regulator [Actinokineospora diospyrosa]MCP2274349.1 transcriptional regulator, PadR family [Actinokineospora diospyrosa]